MEGQADRAAFFDGDAILDNRLKTPLRHGIHSGLVERILRLGA